METRTNSEMKTTELKAKVDKGTNIVFWIAVGCIIGLCLSAFGMQKFTQESCLYLSGFFACLGAFAYVFWVKK